MIFVEDMGHFGTVWFSQFEHIMLYEGNPGEGRWTMVMMLIYTGVVVFSLFSSRREWENKKIYTFSCCIDCISMALVIVDYGRVYGYRYPILPPAKVAYL